MIDKIKHLASEYYTEIVEIRRHLHKYPELSFQEYETSKFIKSVLNKWGIPFQENIAVNGIVVVLEGQHPESRTIALRADFDALPIFEKNNIEYCSVNEGVMHACGHDAHTSSLLGTLKILNHIKDLWKGTIKFIFQPAEEMLPGGAQQMIKEGVLENPNVQRIYAQHVFPDLEVGKIGFKAGKYMASTDELYVSIIGKGGHAALPEKYNNPILSASELILTLDRLFKQEKDNLSVFAIGFFEAIGSTNIIPESIKLKGTFRSISETFRNRAHKIMMDISKDISKKNNVIIDFDIQKGFPSLINDESLTNKTIIYAKEYVGDNNVVILPIRMTAEDFAYYSRKIPSCFYRLGTANFKKGITHQLHTSHFNIDEKALQISMGLMAYIASKN